MRMREKYNQVTKARDLECQQAWCHQAVPATPDSVDIVIQNGEIPLAFQFKSLSSLRTRGHTASLGSSDLSLWMAIKELVEPRQLPRSSQLENKGQSLPGAFLGTRLPFIFK